MRHYPERGGGYDGIFEVREYRDPDQIIELGGTPERTRYYTMTNYLSTPLAIKDVPEVPNVGTLDCEVRSQYAHTYKKIDGIVADEEAGVIHVRWHNVIYTYHIWQPEYWDGTLEHR